MQQYGLVVGNAEIQSVIAKNPSFQGIGGSFDKQRYLSLLQQARITETQYVADVRREIASAQLSERCALRAWHPS
jgi:peptidyl-prolyl cis-trans isomerase D